MSPLSGPAVRCGVSFLYAFWPPAKSGSKLQNDEEYQNKDAQLYKYRMGEDERKSSKDARVADIKKCFSEVEYTSEEVGKAPILVSTSLC